MSSHLTRAVFRRIIQGRPIQPRNCLRRVRISALPPSGGYQVTNHNATQRRFIFGFGDAKIPKGWSKSEQYLQEHFEVLQNTSKHLSEKIRTPAPPAIAKAIVSFFKECREAEIEVTDLHAKCVLDAWKYLESIDEANLYLSDQDARMALEAMAASKYGRNSPKDWNPYHKSEEVKLTPEDVADIGSYAKLAIHLAHLIRGDSIEYDKSTTLHLVTCLASSGKLHESLESLLEGGVSAINDVAIWRPLLEKGGFEELEEFETTNKPTSDMAVILAQCYIRSISKFDGSHSLERYILKIIDTKVESVQDLTTVMETAWTYQLPEHDPIMKALDTKFDTLFSASQIPQEDIVQWSNIKLARELTKTNQTSSLDILLARFADGYDAYPDVRVVSYLLRSILPRESLRANDSNALALVNSRIADVLDWTALNIKDDHEFQRDLELFYFWIEQGFITEAMECFDRLRNAEILSDQYALDFERAEERIIQALCKSQKLDESQQDLVAETIESQAIGRRWQPDTLAALLLNYLRQGSYDDLIAVLNENIPYYNITDRRQVINSIVEFAFDPSMSVDGSAPNPNHTWNTYVMLMTTGLPVSRDVLTRFMKEFIHARFIGETVQVFSSMRMSLKKNVFPNESVYINIIRGLGAYGDLNSVQAIHNHLKLDTRVDPSSAIWTELLMAYAICEQPHYALTFWDQLFDFPERPTERSLLAALIACETSLRGALDLDRVWTDAIDAQIPITSEIFAAYIAALVAAGKSQEAKGEIIANAEKFDRVPA